jgi:hypothetical protein
MHNKPLVLISSVENHRRMSDDQIHIIRYIKMKLLVGYSVYLVSEEERDMSPLVTSLAWKRTSGMKEQIYSWNSDIFPHRFPSVAFRIQQWISPNLRNHPNCAVAAWISYICISWAHQELVGFLVISHVSQHWLSPT